jgi:hypothetical protein
MHGLDLKRIVNFGLRMRYHWRNGMPPADTRTHYSAWYSFNAIFQYPTPLQPGYHSSIFCLVPYSP